MTNAIMTLFGRSPIRPLQEHIDKVLACTKTLLPFIDAVIAEDWQKAEQLQHTMVDLEQQADDIKRDIHTNLPGGLFLPVPRTDLIDMVRSQDRIANRAKDIAGLMLGRKMKIPSAISEDFKYFIGRSVEAAAQAHKAIQELDELLEAGFSGHEAHIVESMITELDGIEQETDNIQIEIRRKLFALEKDLPPVEVMFLYNIIEWIGDLADRAQKVGAQLHMLLVK
jgi:predicted phosphate transport protein (TIGR00153 family)